MRTLQTMIVFLALALVFHAYAGTQARISKTVVVSGPTIIVVFPPDLSQSKDDGVGEAFAHTEFAVSDTLKCLGPLKPRVVTVYADRVQISNGKASATIDVYKIDQAIGAILVDHARAPKPTIAELGPSTLQWLLPQAASQYWKANQCAGDA